MKKKQLLFACVFFLNISLTYSQIINEIEKNTAVDRQSEDRFGWALDISNNYSIIGAYGDDFGGSNPNMGSAYIYEKTEDSDWAFAQKIYNGDQDDYDRFGWSVAIHGDIAVIGAYGEDEDENDENSLSKAGSAYIFKRNESGIWEETQKIVASDRLANDEFGFSVAIYDDLIVVGAHYNSINETGMDFSRHAGAAYIFEQNISGDWEELQKIVASDRSGNPGLTYEEEDWNWRFGESVAVYEDYVVVGSPFAGRGYVYERTGDTWTEEPFLAYPWDAPFDRAGIVSIDSTTIVFGAQTWDYSETYGEDELMNAGGAAIFNRDISGNWNFTQMIVGSDRSAGDHFGISVSVDGDYIISGAHQDNHDEDGDFDLSNAGSAYVFHRVDGVWSEIQKLDASDRAIEDQFGIAVGVSEHTLLVGAYQQDFLSGGGGYQEDAGAVYFFKDDVDEDCPAIYTTHYPSICEGESYEIGESSYTESGTYPYTYISVDGCDSIVTTVLNVISSEPYTFDVVICDGNTVIVGDSVYTEAGVYTNVFETEAGCDSIVETTIIVEPAIEGNEVLDSDGTFLYTSFEMDTYQWINCETGAEISGEVFPFFTPFSDGEYAVIVSLEGCIDTSDCFHYSISPPDGLLLPTEGIGDIQTSCTGRLFDSGGEFSPYHPYENGQMTISPTGAESVTLSFTGFDVEFGGTCEFDQIRIYDGASTSSPLIGAYCNSTPPPATITSSGASITIAFTSNEIIENSGFIIDWSCTSSTTGISKDEKENSYTIYPNPNNGTFTIDLGENNEIMNAQLINEIGQVIFETRLDQNQTTIELYKTISKGYYTLVLSNEKEQIYKRMVVQ